MNNSAKSRDGTGFEIAVVGMAGRFPGAKTIEEFWQNLRAGRESITRFSDAELIAAGADPRLIGQSRYVKAWGVLPDAEMFDASFFGINPRDAEITDPQHRLFLECAWEALEHAGYDAETYRGSIGVYGGASMNTYLLHNLQAWGDLLRSEVGLQTIIGNDKDYLTTRVSYKLNLTGPSIAVQTSCSTSLVAVHLACQSLLAGDCDMALAGGVTVRVPQTAGYLFEEGYILSPDGHCRAFDAAAEGTVWGSGVGIVVLKRLEDALAAGDFIHAVIKGTAVNNDGVLKIGYTAPSIDGQAKMIGRALAMAETPVESISYVEAHGTGTTLGDPIEIAALTEAFRSGTRKRGFCAVGSVKTNIGHLGAAAGVTGLIKVVLALKYKQLPPSLNFEQPNPKIDFVSSPFYVQTELSEWKPDKSPRRAGVSSLGIGGTNAHAILEEPPPPEPSGPSRPRQLLVLSGKTATALEQTTTNLAAYLKKTPDLNLADVAYTLQVGRKRFSHRRMLVCRDPSDAVIALEAQTTDRVVTHCEELSQRPVAFLFPGLAACTPNMGSDLYRIEPTFREQVDHYSTFLRPYLRIDLRDVLYPNGKNGRAATHQLEQIAVAKAGLFVIEYALAKLWMSWGVHPSAMIGHGIGEYVVASLAGVFSAEDALKLLVCRARLVQRRPAGSMLAVPLPEREIHELLDNSLSLAAIDAPSLCVVSGRHDAVEALRVRLLQQGIHSRRLDISHAFQSQMMDPILPLFMDEAKKTTLKPPQIPYVSTITGTWISAAEATSPSYWADQLRRTVRFNDGLRELFKEPHRVLLEVGPGTMLSSIAGAHPEKAEDRIVLSSLHPGQEQDSEVSGLLDTLGRLWLGGCFVDWAGFSATARRRRVPLPTYPFERRRFWIESNKHAEISEANIPQDRQHPIPLPETQPPNQSPVRPAVTQTQIESLITGIWQEVLGMPAIGVHDNFFELGGHSLLAAQVIVRLRKTLNVELSPEALLATATIAELAAYIETLVWAGQNLHSNSITNGNEEELL